MSKMTEAERIAGVIKDKLPEIKAGSLRFWGSWFGRPYDNLHRLVNCEFDDNLLGLHFNESEVLRIWEPEIATIDGKTFRIEDARRVRWEWFSYGRPKIPANLYFEDFTRELTRITVDTNVDWYTPSFHTDLSLPAVEILRLDISCSTH